MTQISRRKMSDKILNKLYKLFFQTVSNKKTIGEFQQISDDLFSKTEQIMIAKRIAIFYLLIKKIDHYTISRTLKVSSSTIVKFSTIKEKSLGIIPFLNRIVNNEKIGSLFVDLYNDVINTNWSSKYRHRREREIEKVTGM